MKLVIVPGLWAAEEEPTGSGVGCLFQTGETLGGSDHFGPTAGKMVEMHHGDVVRGVCWGRWSCGKGMFGRSGGCSRKAKD